MTRPRTKTRPGRAIAPETWEPVPPFDPALYECKTCSRKAGSPDLCRRCLDARAAAGSRWIGPLPAEMRDDPDCPSACGGCHWCLRAKHGPFYWLGPAPTDATVDAAIEILERTARRAR